MGNPDRSPPSSPEKSKPPSRLGKAGILLAVSAAVLAAVLYHHNRRAEDDPARARMSSVLASLLRQEGEIRPLRRPRVAVGYGACRDLFVNARDIFSPHEAPARPEHYLQVEDEGQLRRMFAYFFQHGAAAE